jgi:hypothetical protein
MAGPVMQVESTACALASGLATVPSTANRPAQNHGLKLK